MGKLFFLHYVSFRDMISKSYAFMPKAIWQPCFQFHLAILLKNRRHQRMPLMKYFDQISAAVSTLKLAEMIFLAVFNLFVHFRHFSIIFSENKKKFNKVFQPDFRCFWISAPEIWLKIHNKYSQNNYQQIKKFASKKINWWGVDGGWGKWPFYFMLVLSQRM